MTGPSFEKDDAAGGRPGYGTPGQQPGYGAPGQPPYGQQPGGPVPYGQPPGGFGGPAPYGGPPAGKRPTPVTAAAVVGIVWGALGALLSLVVMLAAFELGATVVGLLLLLSLTLYVALLVGGINVLRGQAPKLLLYASYALVAVGVLSFVASLVATGGSAANGVLGIVITAAIAALLLQPPSKQYFAARGQGY
ncbi:hypothetical protein [Geodermatophilus maliterrae]|uniref:Integral membrane protein n=1 Tax=Geodermatophilus maliterrae TaxID=3162531 RepID=A0ABV3XAR1_9ACTN